MSLIPAPGVSVLRLTALLAAADSARCPAPLSGAVLTRMGRDGGDTKPPHGTRDVAPPDQVGDLSRRLNPAAGADQERPRSQSAAPGCKPNQLVAVDRPRILSTRGVLRLQRGRQLNSVVRQRRQDMRCVLLPAAVVLVVISANAAPVPLPKGHKIAEPPVRFEGIDKLTDYVFCLQYFEGDVGDPPRITIFEVKDSNATKLIFKTKDSAPKVTSMYLLAMERQEFDIRKKRDPSLGFLAGRADGVVYWEAKIPPPETTVPISVKYIPVTTYRVTFKDRKLSAEKVNSEK